MKIGRFSISDLKKHLRNQKYNFQKSPRSGLCRFSDMRQQLLNFTLSRRDRRTQKPTSDILTLTDLTIGNISLKI